MPLLIVNARLAGEDRADAWVLVDGPFIRACGHGQVAADVQDGEILDACGALLMPGAIDCHVHMREPGLTAKADMASESHAALAGGVTSVIDMPNTKPQTTTIEAWQQKMDLAASKCMANYAFFIGATSDNMDQLLDADYTRVPGVKLFMGSSTGNMLLDSDEALTALFAKVPAIVAVHAEDQAIIDANTIAARMKYAAGRVPLEMHSLIRSDEACMSASMRAVDLALKHLHRLHICHLSTALELQLLESGALEHKLITSEVSPHHLLWCADDYATRGARIKMNPAVKSAADRAALRQALADGLIDIVATDHAPHLLSDKEGDALTAASGAPLVQFSLPIMLTLMGEEVTQRAMCANPVTLYGIDRRGRIAPGYYADLVLLRSIAPTAITDADVVGKCGWTPAAGMEVTYRVERTFVNGWIAYDNGYFTGELFSMPLKFNH